MSDEQFLSLIKDLERAIGVPLDLRADESITFTFDGAIRVTLTPDERGNVVFDADFGKLFAGEGQAEMGRLLLLQNFAARMGNRLFAAIGKDGRIVLTQVVPLGELDAQSLTERMQLVIDEVEALQKTVEGLAADAAQEAPLSSSEEMLRTQTFFLKA